MKNRLFIFAGYSNTGTVSDSLLYYIKSLYKLGDIVLYMDCDVAKQELSKISKYCLYVSAKRHGEYDFGSYKRGYLYSKKRSILDKYNWIYFVNDSVYGPIFNLSKSLSKMEKSGAEFTGMLSNVDINIPKHIQSWFVGIKSNIICDEKFNSFMNGIQRQENKNDVIMKYEIGMSKVLYGLTKNSWTLYSQNNHKCNVAYKKPYELLKHGIPFIKKSSIQYMFSKKNIKQCVNNDEIYKIIVNDIETNGIKIKRRPFRYFLFYLKKLNKFFSSNIYAK